MVSYQARFTKTIQLKRLKRHPSCRLHHLILMYGACFDTSVRPGSSNFILMVSEYHKFLIWSPLFHFRNYKFIWTHYILHLILFLRRNTQLPKCTNRSMYNGPWNSRQISDRAADCVGVQHAFPALKMPPLPPVSVLKFWQVVGQGQRNMFRLFLFSHFLKKKKKSWTDLLYQLKAKKMTL